MLDAALPSFVAPADDDDDDDCVLGVRSSLNGRRWLWRDAAAERIGLGLAQRLGVPELMGRLLAARGIDHETAAHFLEPTLRALLPDPHTLADMEAAATRLARAVTAGETVAVFGDYDVDGACAGAIMASVLRALGVTVISYVPDRMREGYGPNPAALRGLAERGASLIVCVDCGSAAAVALGAVKGIAEVLVLDHHACEGPPPSVIATVNPNRPDCGSGMGSLCAAGVTFLAAVATLRVLRRASHFAGRAEPDLMGLLDLVALATVCDVMPLVGLNRAFVVQGLRVLARRERPGLAALLEVARARDRPDAHTLGFALGPRINAAGRISEADLGLRLLLCADPVEARTLAASLDAINRTRQDVEHAMLDAALARAEAQLEAGHAVVVLAGEGWHPGVVGIVAGRIKERFNRPALVAGIVDGVARGSARSVPGLDLGAAVIAARQAGLLTTGGGHAMAAGFALPEAGLAALHGFMDERLAAAASMPRAADLLVEGTLQAAACTTETAAHLGRLAPYGHGNAEPLMVLPRMRVSHADRIGKDGATIRAMLTDEAGSARVKALMFRAKEGPLATALLARDGAALHLAGHLRAEEWNGSLAASFFLADGARA